MSSTEARRTSPSLATNLPACPARPIRTLHCATSCVKVSTRLSWAVVSTIRPAANPCERMPAPSVSPSRPPRLRTIHGEPFHPGLRSTEASPVCQGAVRRSFRLSNSARSLAFSSITSRLDSARWVHSCTLAAALSHDPEARRDHPARAVRWWLYVVFIQPNATPHNARNSNHRWVRARRAKRFRTAPRSVSHQEWEAIDVFQCDRSAFGHRMQRIVCHVHGQLGLLGNPLVQPA